MHYDYNSAGYDYKFSPRWLVTRRRPGSASDWCRLCPVKLRDGIGTVAPVLTMDRLVRLHLPIFTHGGAWLWNSVDDGRQVNCTTWISIIRIAWSTLVSIFAFILLSTSNWPQACRRALCILFEHLRGVMMDQRQQIQQDFHKQNAQWWLTQCRGYAQMRGVPINDFEAEVCKVFQQLLTITDGTSRLNCNQTS